MAIESISRVGDDGVEEIYNRELDGSPEQIAFYEDMGRRLKGLGCAEAVVGLSPGGVRVQGTYEREGADGNWSYPVTRIFNVTPVLKKGSVKIATTKAQKLIDEDRAVVGSKKAIEAKVANVFADHDGQLTTWDERDRN